MQVMKQEDLHRKPLPVHKCFAILNFCKQPLKY